MDEVEDKSAAEKAHRAEASARLTPVAKRLFKYVEFDEKEELLYEIHKHPIGIIGIATIGIGLSLVFVIGAMILVSNLDSITISGDSSSSLKAIIIFVGFILSIITLAVSAISIVLYRSNVVYLTDQKIAEVAYLGIFNRKVTQLGNGNVEDVTSHQRGLLARLFNFGTMIVETASERENLTFSVIPNPTYCSQLVIQAHEAYIVKNKNA